MVVCNNNGGALSALTIAVMQKLSEIKVMQTQQTVDSINKVLYSPEFQQAIALLKNNGLTDFADSLEQAEQLTTENIQENN